MERSFADDGGFFKFFYLKDQHDLIGLLGLRVDEVMYAEVMGCGVWATANCISAISVFIGELF